MSEPFAGLFRVLALCLTASACGGAQGYIPAAAGTTDVVGASAAAPSAAPPRAAVAQADVDLREPGAAMVHGTRVAFDGIQEGLAWPALDKALPPRKPGDVLTVQVARSLPTVELLRAAWTLRQANLHIQSLDAAGLMRVVVFDARRDGGGASAGGCHLAVFLRPDGSLRIASPGGPVTITGDDPNASLARSLVDERTKPNGCSTFGYIAFGAESDAAPWGPLFDVILAVDGAKAAGDARYVLGQAMHATAAAAP